MAVRRISIPWDRQPQEAVEVNSEFGPNLEVWMPHAGGLIDVAGMGGATFVAAEAAARLGNGYELAKLTSNYANGMTFTTRPGASWECWLIVIGSTLGNSTLTQAMHGKTTDHGMYTTSNGLCASTGIVRLRAASTYILTAASVAAPGDVIWYQNKGGDHRLYHREERLVTTVDWGSRFAGDGLSLQNDSFALLARWTNHTPHDDQINALMRNPWQLCAPQQIWVPRATVAAGVPTLSLPTAFNITNTTATPRVTVIF